MSTYTPSPLKSTYNMFRDQLAYTNPLSYDDWNHSPSEHKAALLYVQFYDQISLAWYKAHKFWGDEEEGVETLLDYLARKNVSIIEANPAKFTPSYIYQVAYNCMYCICHDRKVDKDRWELEVSNIVSHDDGELDLFDTVPDCPDMTREAAKSKFWAIIENMDEDVQQVVSQLIDEVGETRRGRKHTISDDRRNEILAELRSKLGGFKDIFCD